MSDVNYLGEMDDKKLIATVKAAYGALEHDCYATSDLLIVDVGIPLLENRGYKVSETKILEVEALDTAPYKTTCSCDTTTKGGDCCTVKCSNCHRKINVKGEVC